MNKNEEKHEFTEREMRAWQDGAKRRKTERVKLTAKQRIEFLKLVAQLATTSTFERRLGLNASDVEFYKKKYDVESQGDARRLYKRLEVEQLEGREDMIISETSRARQAEEVANQRLKELEQKRIAERIEKAVKAPDANVLHKEDAERQRRFVAEQENKMTEALSRSESWTLALVGTDSEKRSMIDRFRKDIEYCGMTFCVNKYHVQPIQIKAEAARLKLRINWDRIKR